MTSHALSGQLADAAVHATAGGHHGHHLESQSMRIYSKNNRAKFHSDLRFEITVFYGD